MNVNTAVLNRQGEALFNFWLKKRQNDKCIGDLTVSDFIEMCKFLAEFEANDAEN